MGSIFTFRALWSCRSSIVAERDSTQVQRAWVGSIGLPFARFSMYIQSFVSITIQIQHLQALCFIFATASVTTAVSSSSPLSRPATSSILRMSGAYLCGHWEPFAIMAIHHCNRPVYIRKYGDAICIDSCTSTTNLLTGRWKMKEDHDHRIASMLCEETYRYADFPASKSSQAEPSA
jgi:hypothetical protein